jgi:dihydroflavonol-4-reductase
MRVLVTGATGFLGNTIVRHLNESGHRVAALVHRKSHAGMLKGLDIDFFEGDVLQPKAIQKAAAGCEAVMHLASLYAFYPWWDKRPRAIYHINIQGTRNVCEASLKAGTKRFIFTSSIASIGKEKCSQISNEDTIFDLSDNWSHYARSKVLAEYEVFKFCARGLPGLILNPAILMGAGDHRPTPSGEMIVNFLKKAYPFYFDCTLALADVEDVARAHVKALTNGSMGNRYILCNKEQYSLESIFGMLESISGIQGPKLCLPGGAVSFLAHMDEAVSAITKRQPLMPTEAIRLLRQKISYDNTKAVEQLGYTCTPIRQTLKTAVDWFRKNSYA